MLHKSDYFLETGHVVSVLMYADTYESFISSDVRHIVTNPRMRVELLNYLVDIGLLTDTRDDKRTRTIHYSITENGEKAVEHIRIVEEIARTGNVPVDSTTSD